MAPGAARPKERWSTKRLFGAPLLEGKSHATFDVAGAGNVTMAAGLKATAKAVEHPTGA